MVEYEYNPELINIIYIILIILFKSYKSIASVPPVSPVCNFKAFNMLSSYNLVLMMYTCFPHTRINIKIIVMIIIMCK